MVRRSLMGSAVALGAGLILVGCATTPDPVGEASETSGPVANGTVYTYQWDESGGNLTLSAHAIAEDGSLAAATQVLSGPADDSTFPGVVDGVGAASLTGSFTDYWTTDLQVRQAGAVTSEVAAPSWCGGEGLSSNVCVLLDGSRVARTTELGRDPETGEGPSEGSIIVSSLADGSTLSEFGPYPDLASMLGTSSPDAVLLVTQPAQSAEDPAVPSTVQRLSLTDGSTTELGQSPPNWAPLCAIGADSVLGYATDNNGADPTAAVVGPATVGTVTWDEQDLVVGCSADGRFLYVQQIPQPPTEEMEDTEPPNPATTIDRITLADGTRSPVVTLEPGVYAGPVGR